MLGATLAARALAKASTEIVPALDAVVVRTLAAAWMGSGLLNGLAADRHPALALAFASAGVPLTRPVSDEQVVSLEALNHAQRLELVALVERGAEATPGLWDTLGLALTTAGGMGGTWGQLLDALAGIHTPARWTLTQPSGARGTPGACAGCFLLAGLRGGSPALPRGTFKLADHDTAPVPG